MPIEVGVKEKVLAAARAGITTVPLPGRNQRDLEDVPESIRNSVQFIWLDKVEDAVAAALGSVAVAHDQSDRTAVAS